MGKCISNYFVHSMNVTDVGGELRYVVQLTCLTRRVTIGAGVQCKCEWLVISEDMKMSAFKEKWQKCLITRYTASNSLLKVL